MSFVYFAGPSGRIEGFYHASSDQNAPVALVLHPDPVDGGNMNNKVAFTLFKSFVSIGFSVLRINFPGVGNSEGVKGTGDNEFRAASMALDWLQANHPDASHYWIAGFSFGSLAAMHIATRRPEIEGFVIVAPPSKYDFSFCAPCPLSGLIIAGEKDNIAPIDKVSKLAESWSKREGYSVALGVIPGADHFFTDNLDEILNSSVEYINTRLAMRIAKPVRKKRRKRRKRQGTTSEDD